MPDCKEWLTIAEIAETVGKSQDYVRGMIEYLATPDQQRPRTPVGRGRKSIEYHIDCLPGDMRLAVQPDTPPLPVPSPPPEERRPEELKDWQRAKWSANIAIVQEVRKLADSGLPMYMAIQTFCNYYNNNMLPESVQAVLRQARSKETLAPERIRTLCKLHQEGGELALMPAEKTRKKNEAWIPYFIRLYNNSLAAKNGITVADCYRKMLDILPKDINPPTYQWVAKWNANRPSSQRNKGRITGNALKATKAYTAQRPPTWPLDCVFCDGHSFRAYVKHPETGKATILEVCWVIDWTTRMPLGFAVGLAESQWTVSGALLRAMTRTKEKKYGGIPLVLKTDGGSGNLSKLITSSWGLLARAGVAEHQIGRPGDPDCQSIIEVGNKILINAARQFWTYRGDDADAGSLRKKMILIEKNEKQNDKELGHRTCTLSKVPTVDEIIKGIAKELNDYSKREHTGLPEYYCPIEKKNKHYSPVQYWQHLVEAGWQEPPPVPQAVLESFQFPRSQRVCRRALVHIGNCVYYSPELGDWHDKKVLVERLLWDATVVKVYDLDGRKICEAQLDGHVKDALALTPLEEYRVRRVQKIIKLKEQYIDDQRHELDNLLNPPLPSANPEPELGGLVAPLTPPIKPTPPPSPRLPAPAAAPILSPEEFHAACAAAVDEGRELSVDERELLADYYASVGGQEYLEFGGRNLLA